MPRRLCPLSYHRPATAMWGPAPLRGLAPASRGDLLSLPRPGALSWAVGVSTTSRRAGVRTMRPPKGGLPGLVLPPSPPPSAPGVASRANLVPI